MTTFHIKTVGCSHNFADSEQMAGLLQRAKFTSVPSIEEANIVIFNTCTVKGPTESAFFTNLEKVKEQHPHKTIIITGCIPQTDPEKLQDFSLLGTRQIHHIVEVVEEALHDNIVKMLDTDEMPPLDLPKIRKNPVIEIIPISRGCLSACTFCKTKSARGILESYRPAEIVQIAKQATKEGCKEIWLTSQDTGCYGFDINTNLPELLSQLIKLPGNFKIRIGMMNPVHYKKIKDLLIPLLQDEKIFSFLHLPAQSGSTRILEDMKRGNTAEEYIKLVQELKKKIPPLTLSTDIIVGFPGETDEEHWKTTNLLRTLSPDVINISKFWARPKTPAAELEQLPGEMIKHRSKIITDISHNIVRLQNEKWFGWEGKIIIDEAGKVKDQWIGHNSSYKLVAVNGNYKLGDVLNVKIKKTDTFTLYGEVKDLKMEVY